MKNLIYPFLLTLIIVLIDKKSISQSNILHLNLGSHNEMSDPSYGVNYNNSYQIVKSKILQIADSVIANNAKWNMQIESNFIRACLQQDNAYSNSNDIIELMDNLTQVEVDPHNHLDTVQFNNLNYNPYNYADLNHLLDSCGLTNRTNVGGFIYQAQDWETYDGNWTLWKNGLQGRTFPWVNWTPQVLWGGGTKNHVNDIFPIGIWHPGGATANTYMNTNPNELLAIGNGCKWLIKDTTDVEILLNEIDEFINIINTYPPTNNTFYCATIMFDFRNILDPNIVEKISAVLRGIQHYVDESKVVWQTLTEKKSDWQSSHSATDDNFPMVCDDINELSINNIYKKNNQIQIYPNPSNDIVLFIFPENEIVEINIIDSFGRSIYSQNDINEKFLNYSVKDLSSGIYYINTKSKTESKINRFQVIH